MLKKVTIKKISRTERVSKKTNKPFTSVGIMVDGKEGEKWINGFGNAVNANWQEGDEVEVVIKQNGEYWNFETLTPTNLLEQRVTALEDKVRILEGVPNIATPPTISTPITPQEHSTAAANKIDVSDLPFN